MTTNVFISYAHSDRAAAKELAKSLVKRGYRVSADDVPITEDWAESITTSIEGASNMVVLFSEDARNNPSVMFEWGVAAALGKPIIVVGDVEAHDLPPDVWGSRIVVVGASEDYEAVAEKIQIAEDKVRMETQRNGVSKAPS